MANVAMALRGISRASPQKVTGPPAAAANNSVAAGAVPMPSKSKSATSGISNSNGTLINTPNVAAIKTPRTSLPRYVATTSGLSHWITRPLANPARIMIGERRMAYPILDFAHSLKAGSKTCLQPRRSAGSLNVSGISTGCTLSRRTLITTIGPIISAPTIAKIRRLNPRMGLNTKNTIASAGIFSVVEPWTIATAPSMLARRWKADETGTMQAEHRFIIPPAAAPWTVRRNIPAVGRPLPTDFENRNASASPAVMKANVMPTVTSLKYEIENLTHRGIKLVPG